MEGVKKVQYYEKAREGFLIKKNPTFLSENKKYGTSLSKYTVFLYHFTT